MENNEKEEVVNEPQTVEEQLENLALNGDIDAIRLQLELQKQNATDNLKEELFGIR